MFRNVSRYIASVCALTSMMTVACSESADPEVVANSTEITFSPAELGLGDDWSELEPGLWSRIDDDGDEQFLGIGEAGKVHALASLEGLAEDLMLLAESEESEKTLEQLAELQEFIIAYRDTPVEAPSSDVSPRCSIHFKAFVDAYPIACGAAAKATVDYSNFCSSATESVRTFTSATCGYNTTTHSCGPKVGTQISCSSYSSLTSGSGSCQSYAHVQTKYYSVWDNNYDRGQCGPPPPLCGPCSAGKDCHCGDVCRPVGSICP